MERYPEARGAKDRVYSNTPGQAHRGASPVQPRASLKPARSQGRLLPSKFDPGKRPKSLYFEDERLEQQLQNHPPTSRYGHYQASKCVANF